MTIDNDAYQRALSWNVADHQSKPGKRFHDRYVGLANDVANASHHEVWQYFRIHEAKITSQAVIADEAGRQWHGINVASQDYLGLSLHPHVAASAIEAIGSMGAHSSGAAPMGGGSALARRVEVQVGDVLDRKHVVLFPTGWSAGYGIIAGLVRPHDHVVVDALAHNCLQHGARASTPNVSHFAHNDMDSLERRLQRVRRRDPDAAILVVTESLFSMDSDGPDIDQLIALKDKYEAHLLLDIAHDFGVLGPDGRGLAAGAEAYNGVDYIIGSFSKTFASIGGFIATDDLAAARAVQGYSGSYTFSNYLIPAQLGAITAAIGLVFSPEGAERRERVLARVSELRAMLVDAGIRPLGDVSSMIIVPIGTEGVARLTYRNLLREGIITNCIEFPAVRRGEARLRMQLTPEHTSLQVNTIAKTLVAAFVEARAEFDQAASLMADGLPQ